MTNTPLESNSGSQPTNIQIDTVIDNISDKFNNHKSNNLLDPATSISPVAPGSVLPFETTNSGKVLPANAEVIARFVPGYVEPTIERINQLKEYSDAKENYGTAPGEGTAFLEAIVKTIRPVNAFVFGTGRGRLEQIICEACDRTLVATIDLPQELLTYAAGAPDSNNIRYRNGLGITKNSDIGSIFTGREDLNTRVSQILDDSVSTDFERLESLMNLVVIDANHSLPSALSDLKNAFSMIDYENGGIILVDDFRKSSPLNSSVEAAAVLFSLKTGIPILQPIPRPKEPGLNAAMGMFIVPSDHYMLINHGNSKDYMVNELNKLIRAVVAW
jgi:hypothetical protein